MIPHNKPSLGEEEVQAIRGVMVGSWISQGEKVKEFEDSICKYIGLPSRHGVAVSSGTSAIYLSLRVLGIQKNDEIIFPTYVCSALLNAVDMIGAKPVLIDIEEKDFNLSLSHLKEKVTTKTKAIIVPHIFGVPVNVPEIKELNIPIIEDCAVALGSKVKGIHTGTFGDVTIFSFYATKVITTGQGGMLVSKKGNYVEEARDLIHYDGRREYLPRFNFQMTDIQASIGLVQLSKLESLLENRKKISTSYRDICVKKGWDFQQSLNENFQENWYRFVIKSDQKTVRSLKEHLQNNDIQTSIPIERWELLHNYLNLDTREFKTAELISQCTLSLPIYPDLVKEGNVDKITKALEEFNA